MAIHNAVLRLGRQAMAAHVQFLSSLRPRGGTMLPAQRRRVARKDQVWGPQRGGMFRDISSLTYELWHYLRPTSESGVVLDTDASALQRGA